MVAPLEQNKNRLRRGGGDGCDSFVFFFFSRTKKVVRGSCLISNRDSLWLPCCRDDFQLFMMLFGRRNANFPVQIKHVL